MAELNKDKKKYLVVFSRLNIPHDYREIKNIIISSSEIEGISFTEKWINSIILYLEREYYKYPLILNIIELNG